MREKNWAFLLNDVAGMGDGSGTFHHKPVVACTRPMIQKLPQLSTTKIQRRCCGITKPFEAKPLTGVNTYKLSDFLFLCMNNNIRVI
jgi:hypothetical protein